MYQNINPLPWSCLYGTGFSLSQGRIYDQLEKSLNGLSTRKTKYAKEKNLKMGVAVETKKAVQIVLEYAKHDVTKGGFSEAVEKLENEFRDKTLSFEAETIEHKKFEIAVRQSNTITYAIKDFSESLAAKQVQDCINDRNWEELLKYSPKNKNFKPIPPFSFEVVRWGVKEDVLRPNPHAKSS